MTKNVSQILKFVKKKKKFNKKGEKEVKDLISTESHCTATRIAIIKQIVF